MNYTVTISDESAAVSGNEVITNASLFSRELFSAFSVAEPLTIEIIPAGLISQMISVSLQAPYDTCEFNICHELKS